MPEIPTELDGETPSYGPGYTAALCTAFGYTEPQGKLPVDIYELDDDRYSDKILYNIGYGLRYKNHNQEDTSEKTTKEDKEVILQIGNDIMTINGIEMKLDSAPVIVNNKTLMPIRAIVEAFDCDVQWNGLEKAATITDDNGQKIKLAVNSGTAYCSNKIKQIDTPPVIINNRMMLSINFVAQNFGYTVDWNENEKQIIIKKTNSGSYNAKDAA